MHRFWAFQVLLTSLPIIIFVTVVSHITVWVRLKREQKISEMKAINKVGHSNELDDVSCSSMSSTVDMSHNIDSQALGSTANKSFGSKIAPPILYKSPRSSRFFCCSTRKMIQYLGFKLRQCTGCHKLHLTKYDQSIGSKLPLETGV